MRISIHNQPCGGALGGSERCAAVLAEALCQKHLVTLHFPHADLTLEQLEAFVGVSLPKVSLQFVREQGGFQGTSRNTIFLCCDSPSWHRELSRGQDAFVTFTHGAPPFCHAKNGILYIHFPGFDRWREWPWVDDCREPRSLKDWLWRQIAEWDWRRRLKSYRHIVVNSEYTRTWTRRWWGVDARVVYPPVEMAVQDRPKKNVILSVGRFTAKIRPKNQLEMMQAFSEITPAQEERWDYLTVGGLSNESDDQTYFWRVTQLAQGKGGEARANVSRPELVQAFETARIFWHAGGLGVDEERHPIDSEHFGITAVEAMIAGCVPVVINRGGLRETVEHGVSGFLWNSLEELKLYTRCLMQDGVLLEKMSAAARERSKLFSREQFVAAFGELLRL